jgi:hypothetical protein
MSTARKIELAPDEVYIQEALKDGRARLVKDQSMKALGKPDRRFQSRAKHLDMDHVHRLDLILQQQGALAPIVVFRAEWGGKVHYRVADGFHRHDVYRRAGRESIPAYLIDVHPDSLDHEATVFAAMANQVTLLSRTKEDMRKAVEMLFADPECWNWGNARISRHCGVGHGSVARWRLEYSVKKKIPVPEKLKDEAGRTYPTKTAYHDGKPRIIPQKSGYRGHTAYFTNVGGKRIYLGKNEEVAGRKFDDIQKAKEQRRFNLEHENLKNMLISRDNVVESAVVNFGICGRSSALLSGPLLFTSCIVADLEAIRRCLADLYLIRCELGRPDLRFVIVRYPEEGGSRHLVELARKLGVEFLTPEELVASLAPPG